MPTVALPPATPLTDHVTSGGPLVTVAVSWALVPTWSVGGAPEIATTGPVGWSPTVRLTDAAAGWRGKGLVESNAEKVKSSGPE